MSVHIFQSAKKMIEEQMELSWNPEGVIKLDISKHPRKKHLDMIRNQELDMRARSIKPLFMVIGNEKGAICTIDLRKTMFDIETPVRMIPKGAKVHRAQYGKFRVVK